MYLSIKKYETYKCMRDFFNEFCWVSIKSYVIITN